MISNCQKPPQKTKRQLNSCLHKSKNRNLSSALDTFASSKSSLETSKMSTLTADLGTAAVAPAAAKKHQIVKPPMEAVVVNSIIYSKPSFCRISVDMGDLPLDKKPSTMTKGTCRNSNVKCFSETFCSPSMGLNGTDLNLNTASCLAGLATSSAFNGSADAKVYRMCTTMNGSINHQISELCDNILAMAGFFGVTNNEHDDDSLIEFSYRDDGDYENDDEEDDDEEDFMEDEDDYDDEEVDDDNDVVDFLYECPIETAPNLNCDKKKKVRFNIKPTVHVMHTWSYAYRAARKGEWEMYARDRERFKLRIQRTAITLNPILQREHRQKVYEKRFANLYDNDDYGHGQQYQPEINPNAVSFGIKESKETSNDNESKKPHQKKKRRKRRFCKMGNKHYF